MAFGRDFGIFLLAFSSSCGMISRFMSSEKPLPPEIKGAHRQADMYDLLAWLEVNKKKVAIAAVLLVVVGFIAATVRHMARQKELDASGELLALRVSLNPATNAIPTQPSAFLKIAEDYKGTSAAERARLLAATALYTEGKYAEAERAFSDFVKEFSGSPWAATAAYGVASAQEAQNKPEAFASYQSVATAYANSAVVDDAKLALARIHETRKQPDQALRLYNELLAPRPGAQPGEPAHPLAAERKEALVRHHPELNTNTSPASVTAPLPSGEPTLRIPSAPAGTNANK
jgi:TolA-binding protein